MDPDYTPTPTSCSNLGHDVEFRTGSWDGCHTCEVEF